MTLPLCLLMNTTHSYLGLDSMEWNGMGCLGAPGRTRGGTESGGQVLR